MELSLLGQTQNQRKNQKLSSFGKQTTGIAYWIFYDCPKFIVHSCDTSHLSHWDDRVGLTCQLRFDRNRVLLTSLVRQSQAHSSCQILDVFVQEWWPHKSRDSIDHLSVSSWIFRGNQHDVANNWQTNDFRSGFKLKSNDFYTLRCNL